MDKRVTIIAAILIALGISYFAGSMLLNSDEGDLVIFNITSEEDWEANSGIGWSEELIIFDDGKLQIGVYGEQVYNRDYESHAIYRTKLVDDQEESYNLDELRLEGNFAEEYDSGFQVILLDCSSEAKPGDIMSIRTYCSANFEEYDTGIIEEESGEFVIERDVGDVNIEGYSVVHINIFADKTETPGESLENTYIDSLLLTRQ